MQKIMDSKVCVIGCGGLGGYAIEMLARLGVGNITVVDGDIFEESNLNRQILSSQSNLGSSKVLEASKRISSVNSDVKINSICEFLNKENANQIIGESDLVIDALDSIITRKILVDACKHEKKILIHGAIAGWYGQVSTIYPEDETINKLYPSSHEKGVEIIVGNPSFTPAIVASIQVSEVVKVITSKKDILRNRVLYVDLLHNDFEIVDI